MVFGLFTSPPPVHPHPPPHPPPAAVSKEHHHHDLPPPIVVVHSNERRKSGDSSKPPAEARKSKESLLKQDSGKVGQVIIPQIHGGHLRESAPPHLILHNVPLVLQAPSSTSDQGLGSGSNSRTDGILPLLLYEAQHNKKQLPNWLKHYRYVAYVVYFLISLYSWGYLTFIGYFQAHPRMQIQYIAVVKFLEFNSYSLLSPLLCTVYMSLLAYQVYKRVNLNEGDFFGLLGLLLLFSLINLHDGYGMLRLYRFTEKDYNKTTERTLDPPRRNKLSRNDLHWQYAWSTRPSCAKKYVRDMIYQHEQDMRHFKKQILVAPETIMAQRALQNVKTAMRGMAKLNCKEWHDEVASAKTRFWMRDLQEEFKCCGPYGYKLWREWFDTPEATGCDEAWIDPDTGDIKDCFDGLMNWFHDIFETMFIIMFIQSGLWIISMVFASIHFAAMKYEQELPEKKFSLLNMQELNTVKDDDLAWARPSSKHDIEVEIGGEEMKPVKVKEASESGGSATHKHKHSKKHLNK
ncbi:unnamed protein product [Orchesella dallaii]|uniref:Uncharacterized protein n=1 Tax=Orchesella dallaii TaxID=48710 RepID=A0ABP1S0K6_9HEXA